MKKQILFVIILLTSVITCIKSQTKVELNFWLDSLIQNKMDESKIVGIGVAVIVKDSAVLKKGYGYMDLENKLPFTQNTIINIGSISKPITGASVLRAFQCNNISIYDTINSYLPFQIEKKLTYWNLATHTSGIKDDNKIYPESYYYGMDSPAKLGDFLNDYLSKEGKLFNENNYHKAQAGDYWDYSNIAAGLAGYLVECITDTPLNVYSKKYFFEPLGMENTGWFISDIDTSIHSKLYEFKQNDEYKTIPLYGLTTYPDGGLRTSVADLSEFLIFLVNKGRYQNMQIIHDSIVNIMLSPQFKTGELDKYFKFDDVNNWGLNMEINELDNGQIVVGHTGSDPGVATNMWYNLNEGIGVVLFSNTTNYHGDGRDKILSSLWEYGINYKKISR